MCQLLEHCQLVACRCLHLPVDMHRLQASCLGLQISNAQKAGAVAVLVANNSTTGFFRMQPDSTTSGISIRSASLPFSTAMPLWNSLTAGMALSAQFLPYTLPTGALC